MDDMDIIDTSNSIGVSGMPKELIDKIWKPLSDENFWNNYVKWKESGGKA